ncbi:MAG: C39 family peptidase [Clostridium sp.]
MKIDNAIERGNRYIAYVVLTAYVIIFIFLLPQKFCVEEIIDTSTESTETEEHIESNHYYISGVPVINQFPELPTGCEVTSSAMLLNFYGINVGKEALADEVSKAPLPGFKNGRVEGESPYEYFVGNPRDVKSFGAFNQPMHNLISNYMVAENITGCEFSQVIEKIKNGQPVMAWITRDLIEVQYASSWYVKNEEFWWPRGEHTVIITGVEEDIIVVNDPYDGQEKRYELKRFKMIWETMGKQAIVISK